MRFHWFLVEKTGKTSFQKIRCCPLSVLFLFFRFRLTAPAKSVHWGVPWDVPDDSMLLVGIFEYGLGSWEAIKADQSLELSSKVKKKLQQSLRVRHLRVGLWQTRRHKKVYILALKYPPHSHTLGTPLPPLLPPPPPPSPRPVHSADYGQRIESQDKFYICFTALLYGSFPF